MDDLHPDSDDANVVKIPADNSDNSDNSDDTVDASDSEVTDSAASASEAAGEDGVAPDNGAADQVDQLEAGKVADQDGEAA
ncbi:MAG TPA: hypothetical protein VJR48_06210, partial [Ktedonobacterales bacterium]|nr:hypothetical protein [Ktedonobacterales bacterium]